jgi:hypothetical protein
MHWKLSGGIELSNPSMKKNPITLFLNRYVPCFFILIPGIFYFITACRTPGWVDATLIVSNVVNLELGSWVNCHNLFHILGHAWIQLFPEASVHYALVLLSALFGALTVQLMFLVFLEVTSSRLIAAAGGLVLMMSHSLWWHSTMLEVYTLNTAILAGMLLCIIRYNKSERRLNLYFASFLLGLGCSNHLLMVFFVFGFIAIIVYLLFRRKMLTLTGLMIVLGCFLLGAGLYLFVFTRDYLYYLQLLKARSSDQTMLFRYLRAIKVVVDNATGRDFKSYMFPRDVSINEKRFWRMNYIIVILYNYPSAAILLSLFGFYSFWKRKLLRLTFLFFMIGLIAQIGWSSNFFIWDMYAFSLPVYVLLSLPLVFALHHLYMRLGSGRLHFRKLIPLLLPLLMTAPFVYTAVSDDGGKEGIVKRYFKKYPEWEQAENTWDVVEYLTNPNKRSYDKVARYSERIFQILPEDAHFWNSVGRADYPLRLYYRDIHNIRADIRHHSLFNPFMSHEAAEPEARKMKSCIERGLPVYIASLSYPERLVLDHLFILLEPGKDLNWVSGLSTAGLIDSFPEVGFEKIVLLKDEPVWIYRVVPKSNTLSIAVLPSQSQ